MTDPIVEASRTYSRPLWYELLDLVAAAALLLLIYNAGWLEADPTVARQNAISEAAAQFARGEVPDDAAQRTADDQGSAGELADPIGMVQWRFSP